MNELYELSGLFAPSGYEDAARDYIEKKAASLTARVDALGNLFVQKKGKAASSRPVVLAAYLDEPGLMVREITEGGLVKFGLTADTDRRTILGKTVVVGQTPVRAVVGLKPIHLTTAEERETMPKTSEMYLDVGAPDRAWAAGHISKGDYGVFAEEPCELGQNRVLAKAMGRSAGCSVLLRLMERDLPVDVTFVFTAQRLVGNRGAYGAAAQLQPGLVAVLELCPGADRADKLPKLGGGAVLPAMDGETVYDRDVMALLRRGAEQTDAPIQPWARVEGSGDGAVWQRALCGAKTAALFCPAKYLGAPTQVIDRRDLDAMERTLFGMLMELEADKTWEKF